MRSFGVAACLRGGRDRWLRRSLARAASSYPPTPLPRPATRPGLANTDSRAVAAELDWLWRRYTPQLFFTGLPALFLPPRAAERQRPPLELSNSSVQRVGKRVHAPAQRPVREHFRGGSNFRWESP